MPEFGAQPHYPGSAPIEAYGDGGFRFAGMSHRGSLICLPDGIWAWPVSSTAELSEKTLVPLIERAGVLDLVLLGTGSELWPLPDWLRRIFRDKVVSVDAMPTGAAVRTYNVLVAERRRVAAGLIAVD